MALDERKGSESFNSVVAAVTGLLRTYLDGRTCASGVAWLSETDDKSTKPGPVSPAIHSFMPLTQEVGMLAASVLSETSSEPLNTGTSSSGHSLRVSVLLSSSSSPLLSLFGWHIDALLSWKLRLVGQMASRLLLVVKEELREAAGEGETQSGEGEREGLNVEYVTVGGARV